MLKCAISEISPLLERIDECFKQLAVLQAAALSLKQERKELERKETENAIEQ